MINTQKILDTIDQLNARFQHMAAEGWRGFDCSDQSLEKLSNWTRHALTLSESLEDIRVDLGDCHRCKLASGRNHIVFGKGNPSAKLVFVGEGPGFEEDQQGEPFVGLDTGGQSGYFAPFMSFVPSS